MIELVKECGVYQNAISTYKNKLVANLGDDISNIDEVISTFRNNLKRYDSDKDKVFAYNVLAILYELKGDMKKAKEYCSKSIQLETNSFALAYSAYLEMKN